MVFKILENVKKNGQIGLDNYSVSETSLDQIFVKFMRQDEERRLLKGEKLE
jgi:hypothetical protein